MNDPSRRYRSYEWKALRKRIIYERSVCKSCDLSFKHTKSPLQIHHTYYLRDKTHEPWDYPDSCFELLCKECHEWTHRHNKIPYFDKHPIPGVFHNGLYE